MKEIYALLKRVLGFAVRKGYVLGGDLKETEKSKYKRNNRKLSYIVFVLF